MNRFQLYCSSVSNYGGKHDGSTRCHVCRKRCLNLCFVYGVSQNSIYKICNLCYSFVSKCYYCDVEYLRTSKLKDKNICSMCAQKVKPCHFCKDLSVTSEMTVFGRCVNSCKKCYYENIKQCPSCKNRRFIGELNDNYYCTDCALPVIKGDLDFLAAPITYGIEIESLCVKDPAPFWKTDYDSSIKPAGQEYVSPVYIGVNTNLKSMCESLDSENSVNESCGLHVHLGVDKLDKLYLTQACLDLEDWIFDILPGFRKQRNKYCSKMSKENVEKIRKSKTFKELTDLLYPNPGDSINKWNDQNGNYITSRWCWYNLHSLTYRNTMEIKCHEGTANYDKIMRWVEFWIATVDSISKGDRTNCGFDILRKVRPETVNYFTERYERFKKEPYIDYKDPDLVLSQTTYF